MYWQTKGCGFYSRVSVIWLEHTSKRTVIWNTDWKVFYRFCCPKLLATGLDIPYFGAWMKWKYGSRNIYIIKLSLHLCGCQSYSSDPYMLFQCYGSEEDLSLQSKKNFLLLQDPIYRYCWLFINEEQNHSVMLGSHYYCSEGQLISFPLCFPEGKESECLGK